MSASPYLWHHAPLDFSLEQAGGLDKLTLDSLYEDAIRRSTTYTQGYATSGPVGGPPPSTGVLALPAPPGASSAFTTVPGGFGGPQDPFAASRQVPPPPNVQMAHMAQQQHFLASTSGGFAPPTYGAPQAPLPQAGVGMPQANPFANPYGAPSPYAPQAKPYAANPFGTTTANPMLL